MALTHPQQQIINDDRQRLLKHWLVFAAVLIGLLAFGWQFLPFAPSTMIDKAENAELRLHLVSSNTWPLVAYLQGETLALPAPESGLVSSNRIESVDATFVPRFQVVPTGSVIRIINGDNIAHNTHVFHRGGTIFNVALPLSGITVNKTLTGTGIFTVRCDLHPWMQAWVFVPPSRFYAILHNPGSISFPDLPPGEYVLSLWQPGGPEKTRLISLSSGQSKTLRLK